MRPFVMLILATSALLFSGCGNGSAKPLTHDQYLFALRQIEASPMARDVDRRFFQLAAGDVSREECRTGTRTFADDVRNIVDAIARLHPPRDAADLQRRLVVSAGRAADLLDQLADDVAAGRVACGMPWNRRAYGLPSTAEAERVLAEYARRGYLLDYNSGD
jgi:hypothetical protein